MTIQVLQQAEQLLLAGAIGKALGAASAAGKATPKGAAGVARASGEVMEDIAGKAGSKAGGLADDAAGAGSKAGESIAPAKRDSGTTVLGRYPDYVEMSDALDARRFQIPPEVWDRMTPDERWAANLRFLDRTIQRGDVIELATPASQALPGSSYFRELEYMIGRGYSVSADEMRLLPPISQ